MLRTVVLASAALAALTIACRRMEPMDLHGPSGADDDYAAQSSPTPAQTTRAPEPAEPSPTPRRPSRTPTPQTTTPSPTPAPQSSAEPGRLAGITAAHNKTRAALGLPDLVWTPALARYAQAWADKLKARGCDLQHRPSRGADAQKYGENLYWSSGMRSTPDDVVGDWVAERKHYDIKTDRCRGVCGHYTQVVWRSSVRVGCGVATCGEAEVWVCNYDPPGNFLGQRPY